MKPNNLFMNNRYFQALFTIVECVNNIELYLENTKKFEDYDNSQLLQDAVERNLEIIGEAVKRIIFIVPNVKITDAVNIINTRNKISHGYDIVQNLQIWDIVINHLPLLKQEAEALLNT